MMSKKRATNLSIIARRTLFILTLSCGLFACVQPQPANTSEMSDSAQGQNMAQMEQELVSSQVAAELQNTDCTKCHDSQPNDIKTNGGKHKTEVACLDCHLEHLPLGEATIPQCAMCHDPEDQKHFGVGERSVCLGCHRNPHTPLDITVEDTPASMKVCLTCHGEKGEEFAAFPSKHSQKNCTFCHPTKHKVINRCFTCHDKNAIHNGGGSFMVFEDCLRCHKPHSPLNIHYAADTPSKFCGTCHGDIFQRLSKSKAKHHAFNCAFCHKDKHPTVPNCRDCHAQPHSQNMLTNFNEDCLKCHRDPHDLIF